jgi:hypothetical protein
MSACVSVSASVHECVSGCKSWSSVREGVCGNVCECVNVCVSTCEAVWVCIGTCECM